MALSRAELLRDFGDRTDSGGIAAKVRFIGSGNAIVDAVHAVHRKRHFRQVGEETIAGFDGVIGARLQCRKGLGGYSLCVV